MKPVVVFLLAFVLAAPPAFAQTGQAPVSRRPGRVKMLAGAALIGAGAFVLPATALSSDRSRGEAPALAFGLLSAGGVLLLWGASERRRQARPSTQVAVVVGRGSAVQVRRAW